MTPAVDIIVRARDGHDLTAACLASIRASGAIARVILVDDGSSPAYGDLGQDLTIRHAVNRGAVSATNSGLALSLLQPDTDYVMVMDNDARVPDGDSGWLGRFIAEMEEGGPRCGAIGATTNLANPPQHILTVPQTYTADWQDKDGQRGGQKANPAVPVFVSFCVLLRKAAVRQVGFWDERFNPGNYEDTDYSLSLREAGWDIRVARSVYLHHVGHATFGENLDQLLGENQAKFFNKHGIGRLWDLGLITDRAMAAALKQKVQAA